MIATPETPSQNDIDVRNKYIIELTQRAESAERRVAELEKRLVFHIEHYQQSEQIRDKHESRIAELEAALKKYGSHSNRCARVITFAATCTCGFDEVKGAK